MRNNNQDLNNNVSFLVLQKEQITQSNQFEIDKNAI